MKMKMQTFTKKKIVDLLLFGGLNENTLSMHQLDGTFCVLKHCMQIDILCYTHRYYLVLLYFIVPRCVVYVKMHQCIFIIRHTKLFFLPNEIFSEVTFL